MSDKYLPKNFEKKWVGRWEKEKIYQVPAIVDKKKKFYTLVEFPYPSGVGLHVGHARSWSAMDAYSRKKRMQGYQVLFPMGWDAYGLPAENYAIKMGIHPEKTVAQNIARFKKQFQSLGYSFDWSREINTTDPKYYRWTQWIFIQLFKKGLAYRKEIAVNWCPFCKTNLADEEVLPDGSHERCGNKTEKKPQKQWLLRITRYADRLLEDLKTVDFSEKIAKQQVNWIGRKEGAVIKFSIFSRFNQDSIECFTTRVDTVYGVSAIVIAPEHPFVEKIISNKRIKEYVEKAKKKSEFQRGNLTKEKTGIFSGEYVIHPITNEKIPIWIADYVLLNYGTGAVMLVPAHDKRDYEFAQKFNLPIKTVVTDKGIIINSGFLDGLTTKDAIKKIINYIEEKGIGSRMVTYHLRDWIFSRQRYWGEPIPMIFCNKCKWVPVPDKDLPVKLPYVKSYQPTDTGESPLAKIPEFVNTICPNCGSSAKRETDTMPNWAGSNWYFIRYLDSKNDKEIAGREEMNCWLPVDLYQGGFEHTTLHLLYSRFIYKFLFDIGVVPTKEPYAKRRSHGIVLGGDSRKMSKSFGNVINPDDIVSEYGADTLRIYEMFIGPFDQQVIWNDEAISGVYRFLTRVWKLTHEIKSIVNKSPQVIQRLNKLIIKVEHDLENLKFNTAVSSAMEFVNFWAENQDKVDRETVKTFLKVLSPMAPFMTEELWKNVFKEKKSIHLSKWPTVHPDVIGVEEEIRIPVQVNGKLRTVLIISSQSITKDTVVEKALNDEKVKKYLNEKKYQIIYVDKKIINFVLK